MKRILTGMISTLFLLGFSARLTYGETSNQDFEGKLSADWELKGEVQVDTGQQHSGSNSLKVPADSKVIFNFSKENKFGTLTIWVYDSGVKMDGTFNGPAWGIKNADDDKICIRIAWRSYANGNLVYSWTNTAENAWFANWPSGARRSPGWHKWQFIYPNDTEGCSIIYDDTIETNGAKLFKGQAPWKGGFNGIYIKGGWSKVPPPEKSFYFDDIRIETK